ncbi:MAG: DUF3592 domain-containing protein [Gemmatimonadales bacterium]
MSDVKTVQRLAPPPRAVPLDLSIRVVLGSALAQVGWFLVGFGFVFVWAFDADGAVASAFRFFGEEQVVEGTTTGWRELNVSVNEEKVFETAYAFEVDGRGYTGSSYATGDYVPEGLSVPIEYHRSDPSISRIQGMRATTVGLAVALVFSIPLIGLAFVRWGLSSGLRARRLLAEGLLGHAVLKSEEVTKMEVNDVPVRRLTFEFSADSGGTYEVVATTHETARLKDDETEGVVYDPRHPSDAVLLDDLPGRPAVNARGELVGGGLRGHGLALLSLVLPVVTVFGHGVFLYLSR